MNANFYSLLLYSPYFHDFRFQIKAYNTLNPANVGTSTVEVTVDRNVNAPVFVGTYSKTINENIPLGTSVLTVEARDEDGVRQLYIHLHSYGPVLPDVLVYEF